MTSPARTSPTTTTVVVPGAHLTTALLGPRDHVLRRVEQQFPTTQISVRGNEVRIGGDDTAAITSVAELFEELIALLQSGQQLDDNTLDRVFTMVQASEKPSEILTHQVLRGVKGRQVKPKTAGQKRYIDTISQNVITFGLGPGGYRQVVARRGDGGAGAAEQAGAADHPHPSRGGGGGAARLPPG